MINSCKSKNALKISWSYGNLVLIASAFLILSSSVYPAILSGIQNKEMALISEAIAQLQEKNSKVDSSGYHTNIPDSSMPGIAGPSPMPTTAGPSSIESYDSVSVVGNDEGDFTKQAALSLTRTTQTSNLVNSKAYYDISFRTITAGVIKTVEVDFPPGTYVGAATLVEAVGISSGTIAASGATGTGMKITYTVTNEISIPALTRVRIQIANINNPPDPGASYMVTITTKDTTGTIIDGPTTTNVYNIKQVETADIANNAITTDKLAPGSVETSDLDNGAVTQTNIMSKSVSPDKLTQDTVFLAWEDDTDGNFDILYRKGEPVFEQLISGLSNNIGISSDPSIAIATFFSGHTFPYVHIVWEDDSTGNGEIFYARSKNGGASLESIINLSNEGFLSSDPVVAVNENNVFVAWENEGSEGEFNIHYRKSSNNGQSFGATQVLSTGGSLAINVDPTIAAADGVVHVAWTNGNDILYRRSSTGGISFESIVNISNNAGSSSAPDMTAFQSNVFLVWSDNTPGNDEILFRRSTNNGVSFEIAKNLSNNAGISTNPAVAALLNSVSVVWENERTVGGETTIFLARSLDSGFIFLVPTFNVSDMDGLGSVFDAINPDIALSSNGVYVVWANGTPTGNFEILYRRAPGFASPSFDRVVNLSTNPGFSDSPSIAAMVTN